MKLKSVVLIFLFCAFFFHNHNYDKGSYIYFLFDNNYDYNYNHIFENMEYSYKDFCNSDIDYSEDLEDYILGYKMIVVNLILGL